MGIETRDFTKGTFVNISEGKIALKGRDGSKVTATGLTGYLTDITFREGEDAKYGPEMHLHIMDGDEKYILQMRLFSGYANGILMAIENMDLTQPATFAPWYQVKNDKKKSGINIIQGGKQIQWKYTRDEPNGLPQWELVDDGKGGKTYSRSKQMAFLRNMLATVIAPKLAEVNAMLADAPVSAAPVQASNMPDKPEVQAAIAAQTFTEQPIGAENEDWDGDLPPF